MQKTSLSEINRDLQTIVQSNVFSDPKIIVLLKKAKFLLYSRPNLQKECQQFLIQARRFSQLNVLYVLGISAEKDYPLAIDGLRFFYENTLIATPSTHKCMFIAIHLLFLLSSNQSEEFFTKLESLTLPQLQDKYVQYVLLLNNSIEAGNYRAIFILKKENPLQCFTPFLNRISQTIRVQIAKNAQKAYIKLTLTEALTVFQVDNQQELRKFVMDFAENSQQNVKWIVTDKGIEFMKDQTHKTRLNSEDLITKTLTYARELEKIA